MAAASGKTKFHNSVLSDNIDWVRKSPYGETLDLKCCYKQVCIYKRQMPRLWRPVIVIKDKTTEHGSWAGLPSVPSRKQWKYTPRWPCHTSPQSPILASLVYWLRYKYLSLIWKILETITPNFSPTTSSHEPYLICKLSNLSLSEQASHFFKPVNTAMDIVLGDGAATNLHFVESGRKDWLSLQVFQVLWRTTEQSRSL